MRMANDRNNIHSIARRSVNLTVDQALLEEARALEIPLSATFEAALRTSVVELRQQRWLEENRGAVEDYNARVEKEGTFGEQFGNI